MPIKHSGRPRIVCSASGSGDSSSVLGDWGGIFAVNAMPAKEQRGQHQYFEARHNSVTCSPSSCMLESGSASAPRYKSRWCPLGRGGVGCGRADVLACAGPGELKSTAVGAGIVTVAVMLIVGVDSWERMRMMGGFAFSTRWRALHARRSG